MLFTDWLQGGDNVCVTRGVVSRITTLKYEPKSVYIGGPELLTIQVCM